MPDIGQVNLTNIPGAIIADNSISNAKIQSIDFKQNNPLRFARLGAYSPVSSLSSAFDTWGVLKGMVSVGIPFAKNIGTGGFYHRWATYGTIVNDVCGVLKLDTHTSMRIVNPLIRFGIRFNPNTGSIRRMFTGWGPQRMLTTNSDTAPLTNSESGILFGHGTADTQFYIFHNDGTGACVKDPTGINLPSVATNYILEISANDATGSFSVTLYNVLVLGVRGVILGTGSPIIINTRIPANVTPLYMQNLVMGSTTAQQFNEPYFIEVC